MARKKNSGAAADTKHNKATRQARRDRKLTTKGKELQRQQQKESAEETNLKKSLANLGLNTQEESLNNSFANLGLGTFEEDKMAAAAARNKTTQKEPSRPVEIGDHVEVEESIRKEFIARDPDMANYKMVYMVDPNHRLLILRFPNRRANEAYCGRDGCKPLELRIKPKSGHVELDVPIYFKLPETEHQMNFMYQKALRESSTLQQGGSYGLAGGFGVNDEPEPSKKGKGKAKEKPKTPAPDTEDSENPRNYGPMQKITLGGMIQRYDDTKPRLMAGTFKGSQYSLNALPELSALCEAFAQPDADELD